MDIINIDNTSRLTAYQEGLNIDVKATPYASLTWSLYELSGILPLRWVTIVDKQPTNSTSNRIPQIEIIIPRRHLRLNQTYVIQVQAVDAHGVEATSARSFIVSAFDDRQISVHMPYLDRDPIQRFYRDQIFIIVEGQVTGVERHWSLRDITEGDNSYDNLLLVHRKALGMADDIVLGRDMVKEGGRYRVSVRARFNSHDPGSWAVNEFVVQMESVPIVNGQVVHERIIQQPSSLGHNLPESRQLSQINRIVVHHTYPSGQNPTIQNVNNWWPSNWVRAGYHFLIRSDGSIWQLVPINVHSNGVTDRETNIPLINIGVAGSFTETELPTQAAKDSFGFLCRLLLMNSQIPNIRNIIEHVVGHREVGNTLCPGFTREQYLSWI